VGLTDDSFPVCIESQDGRFVGQRPGVRVHQAGDLGRPERPGANGRCPPQYRPNDVNVLEGGSYQFSGQ